jgi:hypothetical protein
MDPERYIGVDEHAPSLALARRRHPGSGREFVLADLATVHLERCRGADVAVMASVTHHLDDPAVMALLERVVTEIAPKRLLLQDAHATGPIGALARALDHGEYLRGREDLVRLLEPRFSIELLWTYDNPLRSFHQFLLALTPKSATSSEPHALRASTRSG